MKRNSLSKVLSLITAVSLLFGMMVTAHAAEPTLTRGEMAALLVEGAGLSEQVASYQAKPSAFKDVAESSAYKGCINLAYEKGLVSGTGNGCFSPNAKATQVEAAAVVLRSAKVPGEVLEAWPASFNTAADSTGLLAGVNYNANGQVTEAAFRQMMSNAAAMAGKPFIGISWKNDAQDYSSFHDIIALASGVAVELPQISNLEDAKAAVNAVEGIIVTGGEDINPDLYGEKHDPLLEDNNAHRDVRDTSDYNLIRAALDANEPMLTICRGTQMLNVVCGGGLIQDLPTHLNKDGATYVTHRYSASGDYARHDVTVEEDSKWLQDILGSTSVQNVASWHHQVLNPARVGKGLTVVAYGPEDVIEAVEYQANTFALGIQFHPERDALGKDAKCDVDTCRSFFKTLVYYATNQDKPMIGISWGGDPVDYVDMHEIIDKLGGVTVRMPQITSYEDAVEALKTVDGIIMTGGEDINPDLYGEEHSPLLEDNNEYRDIRDTSDYNLIKAAVDEDVPMLAICRGMQMLNVVCGGGIVQDLPTYLGTDDASYKVHRNRPDWARHDITVTDNSKWVAQIVGNDSMKNVASWHHQVLNPERVGKGLIVTSYGPDEVIEAVEYQSNEFTLGIQFHPEADAKENPDFAAFFGTLVKYAGN